MGVPLTWIVGKGRMLDIDLVGAARSVCRSMNGALLAKSLYRSMPRAGVINLQESGIIYFVTPLLSDSSLLNMDVFIPTKRLNTCNILSLSMRWREYLLNIVIYSCILFFTKNNMHAF